MCTTRWCDIAWVSVEDDCMNDFSVKVTYRGKDSASGKEWTYDLKQYADLMKRELVRIIMDVEDALYVAQGDKSKDEWDEETMMRFQRVRHKLLDQANAIERLPQNLYYKDVNCMSQKASEMLAKMIDSMTE